MLEDILLQVNKPGRYIGGEWNASKKDFERAGIKFALCFPDLYEVGMSNLGIRIIYGILNNLPDVCCERFFSPALDLEAVLRSNGAEIFSLESKRRLREFDIVGFSLGYELSYTNVLNILDLGKIPLKSALRGNEYPLVIGGGPCCLNPEPMHEFFDLFLLGEAEEAILEITEIYRRHKDKFKASRISKQDLLEIFSRLEGVYVPSLYTVTYGSDGAIEEFRPRQPGTAAKVKKRFISDLNSAYFPLEWLLPYIQIVHDRITLEIMRGCPNQCRFCQARAQYFPFRQRNLPDISRKAEELYKCTGYEEISLAGLSVSDYPQIDELLKTLIGSFRERKVSISLPSIKPKAMLGELSRLIAGIKKTGLTFAPEAATERLRKVINKRFDSDDFFKTIEEAYLSGYQHIKLYFMTGLPFEEERDLDGIIEFSLAVSELRRKLCRRPAQVNISVNTLIPKPHTPFQWFKMEDLQSIRDKQGYLRSKMRNKNLKLSLHNPRMSFLEGVLSRGDRRLSAVILAAFSKGARFDGWGDYFVFERWLEAFGESKIDPGFYLKEKAGDGFLPWDFLDTGISRDNLLGEFRKTVAIT
ncbi:MAG: TIGR03960 family B12-binding radical SAM protein [Candidatus Omnitrophota bacterium]|jgi:radical SAM family uncharacterized protein